MENDSKTLHKVVQINEGRIQDHLGELVRNSVEETLNAMLDAEVDALCGAQRYERSPDRVDTRARHYDRKFHTKAGEVNLKMPKLRAQTFETAIIERYKRREASIEESLIRCTWPVSCSSAAGAVTSKNVSVLVGVGVDQVGYRRILGVCEGHKEDKAGWGGFRVSKAVASKALN